MSPLLPVPRQLQACSDSLWVAHLPTRRRPWSLRKRTGMGCGVGGGAFLIRFFYFALPYLFHRPTSPPSPPPVLKVALKQRTFLFSFPGDAHAYSKAEAGVVSQPKTSFICSGAVIETQGHLPFTSFFRLPFRSPHSQFALEGGTVGEDNVSCPLGSISLQGQHSA